MAYPFFQGNANDLLDIAGAGQGSFVLGQLMNQQRRQQEEDIRKSFLANLTAQQQAQMEKEMHPLKLEEMRANIENRRANTGLTQTQTQERTFDLGAKEAAGGISAAGRAITEERKAKEFKNAQEAMTSLKEALMQEDWGPDLENRLMPILSMHQVPEQYAASIINKARQGQQAWDGMRNNIYLSSKDARKIEQQKQADFERAKMIQEETSNRAIQVARIREAEGKKAAGVKNFQAAAVHYGLAAEAARAAGQEQEAIRLEAEANRWAVADQRARQAGAAQRQEGTIDPGAATKLPTRPSAPPNQPFNGQTTPNPAQSRPDPLGIR